MEGVPQKVSLCTDFRIPNAALGRHLRRDGISRSMFRSRYYLGLFSSGSAPVKISRDLMAARAIEEAEVLSAGLQYAAGPRVTRVMTVEQEH